MSLSKFGDTSKPRRVTVTPGQPNMRADWRESRTCSASSGSSSTSSSDSSGPKNTAKPKSDLRIPWDEQGSLALVYALSYLGIDCRFHADNGAGALLISMDEEQDARVHTLWDALSDLRVRYIEARQEAAATQLTYLEGDGAAE